MRRQMRETALLVFAQRLCGLEVCQMGTPAIKALPDGGIGEPFPWGAPLPSQNLLRVHQPAPHPTQFVDLSSPVLPQSHQHFEPIELHLDRAAQCQPFFSRCMRLSSMASKAS
jgi:hypothetical protein